jgi:L-asparaginase
MSEDLLYIQMGGTIDKRYPRKSGAYAFEIEAPAFLSMLEKARVKPENIRTLSFCRKDSQDITKEDRKALADLLNEASEERILISHGTDTLIDTGLYLQENPMNKTIVLFGAFLPALELGSDADFQAGFALSSVMSHPVGVYIAMNGLVIPADAALRDPESGAFIRKPTGA